MTLHYLDGRVHVELELPISLAADVDRLTSAFNQAVSEENDIADVRLLFGESHQSGASSSKAH